MNGQALPKKSTISFLALGDSYTIGESVAEVQRWPVQLVNKLNKRGFSCRPPEIIAVTGWRTDDLKNAIAEKQPRRDFDLVSLLIGVNNQYQSKPQEVYAREFEELLEIAIQHARGNKANVFVMSIPDWGYTPFGRDKREEVSRQIDAFNEINRNITIRRGVTYIDITDISRQGLSDPELVASDGLHPSGKMYILWVDRILESLE